MAKRKMKPNPEYMPLSHAAEALGKSKNFVKRAVEAGKLRALTEPFKSNLNSGSSFMLLVHSQDVRDAIAGKIDLSFLEAARLVEKKELPKDLEQFAEMMVNMTQTVEQLAVMVATILERQDSPGKSRPASRRETPE